jgi:hypothetical protein
MLGGVEFRAAILDESVIDQESGRAAMSMDRRCFIRVA